MKNSEGKQKILITGASGFVGSEIVNEFSTKTDFEIYLAGSLNSDLKKEYSLNIKGFYQIDVGDENTFGELLRINNIDTIIHAAGLAHQFGRTNREDFFRTNVLGTENICKLAVKLSAKHFLLISSVSVYGNYGKREVFEDFECRPEGDYAESKLEAEKKALKICGENAIKLTILRLGTVIGENDRGNTARLITLINKNRFIWVGKGINRKSLIYKKDVAGIISQIVKSKEFNGGVFNLTAKTVLMREIVDSIYKSLDKKPLKIFLPEEMFLKPLLINKRLNIWFLQKIENTIKKWLSDEIYSSKKLLNEYNLEPPTEIHEALEKQVTVYQQKKF